jgi:transcriptional regulator with XRE-family HTH domain
MFIILHFFGVVKKFSPKKWSICIQKVGDIFMDFAQILGNTMRSNDISNYRLAKDIGVSQSTIANWLNAKSTPNSEKLQELANYFDVSSDYLLGKTSDTAIGTTTSIDLLKDVNVKNISESMFDDLTDEEKAKVKEYMIFLITQREK